MFPNQLCFKFHLNWHHSRLPAIQPFIDDHELFENSAAQHGPQQKLYCYQYDWVGCEVGIRKILGGNRRQLILQFPGETGMITFFAVLLAVTVCIVALPFLNQLLQLSLKPEIKNPQQLLFLILVTLGVTALPGFYPAMVSSGFNPINALKNEFIIRKESGISVRRGQVIMQFCIWQVLIICVLVMVNPVKSLRRE